VAKALEENKIRDRAVNDEDVKDLHIMVNAAKTVDEFLASI
jgi:hypothetical protein